MRTPLKAVLAALPLSLAGLACAGACVGIWVAIWAAVGLPAQAMAETAAPMTVAPVTVAPLEAPTGPVLLTLRGAIAATNATGGSQGEARFDAAMLAALPRTSLATSTIWTEGVVHFAGVELATLAARLGVTSGRLRITAINDYSVDIPMAEITPGGALLADQRDGKPMSIRDKGPLWVVYPYDASPAFRNEVIYSRSVWQVDRIEILP